MNGLAFEVSSVTCGYLDTHGFTWPLRFQEVIWFHVVTCGC